RTSCQSNLKQLALGLAQYNQDYDSKFMPVAVADGPPQETIPWGYTNGFVTWDVLIRPYTKNTQILSCPSARIKGFVNYFYNANLGVGAGSHCPYAANPCFKNEASISSPSVVITFGD